MCNVQHSPFVAAGVLRAADELKIAYHAIAKATTPGTELRGCRDIDVLERFPKRLIDSHPIDHGARGPRLAVCRSSQRDQRNIVSGIPRPMILYERLEYLNARLERLAASTRRRVRPVNLHRRRQLQASSP